MSLPLGQSASGLPIGIQLAGRFAEEHVLLQLAAQLENALPWIDRRPSVFAGAPRGGAVAHSEMRTGDAVHTAAIRRDGGSA